MIPKIIHICWLSGDPFPEAIVKCLDTFKVHLTDYEIYLWGKAPAGSEVFFQSFRGFKEMHFDLASTPWTQEAFEAKKYAFAADYIRLYALYTYGGIYLDADVLVYKPFDELLHLPYFIGCDQIRAFEAAVIGAERGCMWVKEVLDTYQGKHFKTSQPSLGGAAEGGKGGAATYDQMELPVRFHHELVNLGYRFIKIARISEFENLRVSEFQGSRVSGLQGSRVSEFRGNSERVMYVFDGSFFNSRNAIEVHRTRNSFCAHNYLGSWQKKSPKQLSWKYRLPKPLLHLIFVIGQKTWARNKYAWFQIPFER